MKIAAALTGAGLVAWNSFLLPRVPIRHRTAVNAAGAIALGVAARSRFGARELGFTVGPEVGRAAALAAAAPLPLWVVSGVAAARTAEPPPLPDDLIHPAEWLLWRIPVGTAVAEELYFRSVMHAFGELAITAAAFGAWHVRNAHVEGQSVPTVVAVTTAAGVLLDVLRARTGSVLVPMAMHVSINLAGAVGVVLAHRMAGRRPVDPSADDRPVGTVSA